MPIYEYDCPECGRFETIQKFSDKPLASCPRCQEAGKKIAVKKTVSASAFHLKGSGWYKTDYSSGSSAASSTSKSATSSSSDTSSKSSSGTESTAKPAGKACGTGCGCH